MDISTEQKPDLGLDVPESYKEEKDKKGSCVCHSNKGAKAFITLLIVIILVLMAGFCVDRYTNISLFGEKNSATPSLASYSADSYYAVFLSNGQVYFGKISKTDNKYTTIDDIYYIQVSQDLQQVTPPGTTPQQQLSLVKLGQELHGPKDFMQVNNDHIIFTEELKTDGKVVEAITAYKAGNQPK
ncbi:MAG TPA: hypothetical protein P5267_01440 [Patescibacteria group bacterium]|nr:hypothetical protein [Patescibacteria group bacterium]